MTIAEQLRQEGRAEGIREGRAQERASLVTKLLALRFGPLSDAALAQINAATPAQLETLAERVLTADTLTEALANLGKR